MSEILIAYEKNDTRCIAADDREKAAAYLINDRLADGAWYDEGSAIAAHAAVTNRQAWLWLKGRSRYEYERVEIVDLEPPHV